MILMVTLLGQLHNLTSGQCHLVTQMGHVAYEATRIDETNTMVSFARLYLYHIKSYWQRSAGDLK